MKKSSLFLLAVLFFFSCENGTAVKFFNAGVQKMQQKTGVGDSAANESARQAKLKAALQDFDNAIDNDNSYAKAYEARAMVKKALGDYKGSIADAEKLATLESNPVHVYYFIAQTKFEIKDYSGTVKAVSQAINIDGTNADYYCFRANAEKKLNENSNALKDFDQAIAFGSGNPRAKYFYSWRGILKLDMNDRTGCLDLYKAVALGDLTAQDYINDKCK